jgi:DNA-binding GntR family transcriptional regulator
VNAVNVTVQPLESDFSFRAKAYHALREAIVSMNLYDTSEEIRLDERQLAADLGVSRTPIREAMARLEHEGLVRTVPRRGIFVVRKTKAEILDIITVWAALESMAARLITLNASDEEIASLRTLFSTFEGGQIGAHIDEYSDANIRFHSRIIEMSHSPLLAKMAENLFIHVRSIRHRTITEDQRFERSIVDHMHIIEALERRDTERAERLVRQHTLDLAQHVVKNVHYLA